MSHQDWDPVVLKRTGAAAGASRGGGKSHNPEAARLAKLEAADGPVAVKHKVLTAESVAAIQAYRRTNNLTQKQLDQQLSLAAGMINALESRRSTPPPVVLQGLNRLLKVNLTLE
jgi:ribosome-binding protein aMBF1 (putative translation factor)